MSGNAQTDISLCSFVPPIFVADLPGWKTSVGHSVSTYRQHHIIATTEHKLNTQADPQAKEHLDFSNAD